MPSTSRTTGQPVPDPPEPSGPLAEALVAIARIQEAADPPRLLDRMVEATDALGASAAIYTMAIPERDDAYSNFSLLACHPALAQRQFSFGLPPSHPWSRCARSRSTPATDRQVQSTCAADVQAIDLAREYGFRSCLIVPTPSRDTPDRLEMLCLGSSNEQAFEGEDARLVRTLARSMAAELHDWVRRYMREGLRHAAGLRESDLELFKLELAGLGTKAIAHRTGSSQASVDSRFQRLNSRLACASRRESALRAAAYGLLETD